MADPAPNHVPAVRNPEAYWAQVQENLNKITPKPYAGGKLKPVGNPKPQAEIKPAETFNGGGWTGVGTKPAK